MKAILVMKRTLMVLLLTLLLAGVAAAANRADMDASLSSGTPQLQSAGALAFAPEGILFVGDSRGGAIFALDTQDRAGDIRPINVEGIDAKIAALVGASVDQVRIHDLAVNPASGKAYLSVSRGQGTDATPMILRLDAGGTLEPLSLKNIKFAKEALSNAPAPDAQSRRGRPLRMESITDLAFVDDTLLVTGLSNEEFASKLHTVPFPFKGIGSGTSVEIFHGAHGRWETNAPVRTFVPYEINDEPHVLAAYTCTPLVRFPVSELKSGTKVVGTTVAELGNRNRPLDMVVYQQGGKDYLLMANSSRGVMKADLSKVGEYDGITERVSDKAGLTYETVSELKGVEQLDLLDSGHALILVNEESGRSLKTIPMP